MMSARIVSFALFALFGGAIAGLAQDFEKYKQKMTKGKVSGSSWSARAEERRERDRLRKAEMDKKKRDRMASGNVTIEGECFCSNGGTCERDPNSASYTCKCPTPYVGPTCEKVFQTDLADMAKKFTGLNSERSDTMDFFLRHGSQKPPVQKKYRELIEGRCQKPITSMKDCEAAAATLGLSEIEAETENEEDYPTGCYLWDRDDVEGNFVLHFNKNKNEEPCTKESRCVCEKAWAPPSREQSEDALADRNSQQSVNSTGNKIPKVILKMKGKGKSKATTMTKAQLQWIAKKAQEVHQEGKVINAEGKATDFTTRFAPAMLAALFVMTALLVAVAVQARRWRANVKTEDWEAKVKGIPMVLQALHVLNIPLGRLHSRSAKEQELPTMEEGGGAAPAPISKFIQKTDSEELEGAL